MTLGQRIRERANAIGISQSELGRRAGVKQSTINTLINGEARSTPHLIALAQALRTSPAFLLGATEDPEEGAPLPAASNPPTQFVMMPVALPTEQALSQMFEGLLEVVDRSAPVDELARELAQLLPTALSQLRGPLSYAPEVRSGKAEAVAAPATADLEDAR